MSLGVVIATHGPGHPYEELVTALLDDGVDPSAIALVRSGERGEPRAAGGVVVIEVEDRGFPHAVNAGLRHHLRAGAELLLVLPHDARFRPGLVSELVGAANADPTYGILGPSVYWPDLKRPFSFGGLFDIDGRCTHRLARPEAAIAACDWIDGAAMLVRRKVLEEVGLLDERLFLYFSEPDLSRRAARAGWRTGVVLAAAVAQIPGGGRKARDVQRILTCDELRYSRSWKPLAHDAAAALHPLLAPRSTWAIRRRAAGTLVGIGLGAVSFLLHPPRVEPRHVVVSSYPPLPDGIARYARQHAAGLERSGPVLRVGLPGSWADVVLRLDGSLRPLRLLRVARRRDRLDVMWHPQLYLVGRAWSRIAWWLAFGVVLRTRVTRLVVHEQDAPPELRGGRMRRTLRRFERAARLWCWRGAGEVAFHAASERDRFLLTLDGPSPPTTLIHHGEFFRSHLSVDKLEARSRLGVPPQETVFLCIGFLGRHKGFDRAVRAFSLLESDAARLYVVGSGLYQTEDVLAHIAELRDLVAATPGATLVESFVTDEVFDLWITAADVVLLPYREASSSSVLERAQLLHRGVIASTAGGLPEQIGQTDALVASDDELVDAMRVRLSGRMRSARA
jgi:glycosyltransferase involved in cell wall biosynthesis